MTRNLEAVFLAVNQLFTISAGLANCLREAPLDTLDSETVQNLPEAVLGDPIDEF